MGLRNYYFGFSEKKISLVEHGLEAKHAGQYLHSTSYQEFTTKGTGIATITVCRDSLIIRKLKSMS